MSDLYLKKIRYLPAGHIHSHRLIIITGIIISLFVIIIALTLANSRSSFFGRAASTSTATSIGGMLSAENSYIFASPLSAAADGTSMVRVTVIILNDQGLGVSAQKVSLKSGPGLIIAATQPATDNFGRAIFDVTSSTPGNYTISAEVSGSSLPQQVSLSFH